MFFRISPFVLKTGIYDNIFILNELFIHGFPLNIMKIILPAVFLFVFHRPLVFNGIPHAQ